MRKGHLSLRPFRFIAVGFRGGAPHQKTPRIDPDELELHF